MGIHSVAEAKNRLPDLIDRALAREGVTITRHGRPVVQLRPTSPRQAWCGPRTSIGWPPAALGAAPRPMRRAAVR